MMKPLRRSRAICISLILLLLLSLFPVMSATNAPPYKGLDISRWQGTVNWTKVKSSGVDFAILRCFAYRKDTTFEANYAGAAAQGIPVGAYVYMYATTVEEAVNEAQDTLSALDGRPLALPLFLDVEDEDVKALGKERVTDLMLIELALFEAAGYPAGIYTSLSHKSTDMNASRLDGYDWWIARWSCYTTDANPKKYTFADQSPSGSKKPDCDIWQFSNGGNGSVFGMSSDYVDLNYCYKDYLHQMPQTPTEHTHAFETKEFAPTCTDDGMRIDTCVECGLVQTETLPALGHTEPDAGGNCTRCGEHLLDVPGAESAAGCKWCGGTHDGAFGWLIQIIHNILAAILGAKY